MRDPANLAKQVITKAITEGLQKHPTDDWRKQCPKMHLRKGNKHGLAALSIIEGDYKLIDKEDEIEHLERGLCRYAMALAILKG